MDNENRGNDTALVVLGPVIAALGLLLMRFVAGGAPEALAWVGAVAGGLMFLAGLIGYAVKS